MDLLLISNSTNYKEEYLGWCHDMIMKFIHSTVWEHLAMENMKDNAKELSEYRLNHRLKIAFVPYAGVNIGGKVYPKSYDAYTERIRKCFGPLEVVSVHESENPVDVINNAEIIIIGGGNTFHLVAELHKHNLIEPIRRKVMEGTPYIGWSAGSNVACPTLMTTNDMPIIMPEKFSCLDLVPFQINPHYIDPYPEEINDRIRHGGETRQVRLEEFLAVNQNITVAGLREATALWVKGDKMKLLGQRNMRVMRFNKEAEEFEPGSVLNFNFTHSKSNVFDIDCQ